MTAPQLSIGSLIWVPAPPKSSCMFEEGSVLMVNESTATVRTADRIMQIDLLSVPMICNNTVEADMTSLPWIHDAGILHNLHQRSLQNEPYTFMGNVLVSVNPLRKVRDPFLPGSPVSSSVPHPFVIAEIAFQQMIFQRSQVVNQSIVIAGESGAGKTESAKMVLSHLVAKSSSLCQNLKDLDKRLLDTNPILESFGNSATLRNPNSSRFGKMLRLHFSEANSLHGATIQSYLLERSRVSSHEAGERNFHVFYQLLAGGAVDPTLNHLCLRDKKFRYLEPGVILERDRSDFGVLVQALEQVGITNSVALFEILSGLLHLGEVSMINEETTEGDVAKVTNPEALLLSSQLLGLDAQALGQIFLERKLVIQNKITISKRNARAAGFARDAAVKTIYANLFEWIVKKINHGLTAPQNDGETKSSLGVLDIFGFESFATNGFEQLLINFANESLQGTFNTQIFVAEVSMYQREGLFGSEDYSTRPMDNGVCVELLQGKAGLLALIDAQTKMPDASDKKLLQAIHATFSNHVGMIKPHPKEAMKTFIIRHYAAPVVYTIGTFLEKNNDRLPDGMEAFFATSSKPEVSGLFSSLLGNDSSSATSSKAPPSRSICAKFSLQIKALVDDLETTKCSFIRCVKPCASMVRTEGDSSWFDSRYVQQQLVALNIPQTCEVLRSGFPTRLEYTILVDSYSKVFPPQVLLRYGNDPAKHKDFVRALFWAFQVPPELYKLGVTKVFFKSGQLSQLDAILTGATSELNQEIVTRFRLCYVRNQWRRVMRANFAAQQFTALMVKVQTRIRLATLIQCFVRRNLAKKRFKRLQLAAICGQRIFRGKQGRYLAVVCRKEKLIEIRKQAELADQAKREELEQMAKELEEAEMQRIERARLQDEAATLTLLKQEEEEEKKREGRRKSMAPPSYRNSVSALRMMQSFEFDEEDEALFGEPKRKGTVYRMRNRQTTVAPRRHMLIHEDSEGEEEHTQEKEEESFAAVSHSNRPKSIAPPRELKTEAVDIKARLAKLEGLAREEFKWQRKGFALVLFLGSDSASGGKPASPKSSNQGLLGSLKTKFFSSRKLSLKHQQHRISSDRTSSMSSYASTISASKLADKQLKWAKVYCVLDKPSRSLFLYSDEKMKEVVRRVELLPHVKLIDVEFAVQPFSVEVRDDHTMFQVILSFPTAKDRLRWEKDVRWGIVGFKPPTLKQAADSARRAGNVKRKELLHVLNAELKRERLQQLSKLFHGGIISQQEFEQASHEAATVPTVFKDAQKDGFENPDSDDDDDDDEEEEDQVITCSACNWNNTVMMDRDTCMCCGVKLPEPQKRFETPLAICTQIVFAWEKPFEDGQLTFELMGCEKHIQFVNFEEVLLYRINCYFQDAVMPNLEVEWIVSYAWDQFVKLHHFLTAPDGPLTEASRQNIPAFPDGIENLDRLGMWLKQLFALVPQSRSNAFKQDEESKEEDSVVTNTWRSVRDVESGDVYFFNQATGETSWTNPFDEKLKSLKDDLPKNWQVVVEEHTLDVYYWNTETQETSWEKPKPEKKREQMECKDLLHIPLVSRFFDLKRNTKRMEEITM